MVIHPHKLFHKSDTQKFRMAACGYYMYVGIKTSTIDKDSSVAKSLGQWWTLTYEHTVDQ